MGGRIFFGKPPYLDAPTVCRYFIDDRPSHDSVKEFAYFLWLKDGCPDGQNEEFWFQAEQFLIDQKKE